jgi:hypothetical protein
MLEEVDMPWDWPVEVNCLGAPRAPRCRLGAPLTRAPRCRGEGVLHVEIGNDGQVVPPPDRGAPTAVSAARRLTPHTCGCALQDEYRVLRDQEVPEDEHQWGAAAPANINLVRSHRTSRLRIGGHSRRACSGALHVLNASDAVPRNEVRLPRRYRQRVAAHRDGHSAI